MNNLIIDRLINPHVAVVDRHELRPDPLTFLKGKKTIKANSYRYEFLT